MKLFDWYFGAPRRALALICVACIAMLAFGMYLQHVVGLEPCPMCVVQRYALVLVAVFTGLGAASGSKALRIATILAALAAAVGGAYTAASRAGCSGIHRR